MMKKFVELCLAQSQLNNVLYVLLILVGVFCVFQTPVERYPSNVHLGDLYITIILYGATPSDVEKKVTSKYEKEISKIKEVEYIKSTSARNRSTIKVHFKDGCDLESTITNIKIRLETIQKELPSYAKAPIYEEGNAIEMVPVVRVNLLASHSNSSLNLIAKELKSQLENIKGVGNIQIIGEGTQEYHIKLDPNLLKKHGVTFQSVANSIQNSSINLPMGSLKMDDHEFFLTANEEFKNNEEISNIIIRRDGDGNFLRLGDIITDTEMSIQKPSIILSADGKNCIAVQVHKSIGGNAIFIKKETVRIINEFKNSHIGEFKLETILSDDSTKAIDNAISTLSSSMLTGILFIYILMHYFMGFKNAFLAIIGIPFSFLVTMIFFRLTGNSINEISLFAFILVSGMIVSDAIVILENIHRHRENGSSLYDSVVNGNSEVIIPVVASSFTTIAAFIPLLIMTGSTGAFFSIFPKTISFALIASLIEALFMLPLHYYDLSSNKKVLKKTIHQPKKIIVLFDSVYTFALKVCLNYKYVSIGLLFILGIFTFVVLGMSLAGKSNMIRVKLFPDTYPHYFVTLECPISTPLNKTNEYLLTITNEIKRNGQKEYDVVSGIAGLYINEDFQTIYGYELGMLTVTMPQTENQKFADYPVNNPQKHLEAVLERIKPLIPAEVRVSIRPAYEGPPRGKPVSIRIYGQNEKSVIYLSNKIFDFMKSTPELKGLTNLKTDIGESRQIATLKTNTLKAKDFGLTPRNVLEVGVGLIEGQVVGQFQGTHENVDLKVMIDEKKLDSPEAILNIPIIENAKAPILISDVARFEYIPEISALNRYNELRSIEITAGFNEETGLNPQIINANIKEFYQSIANEYPGAKVNFEGEFKSANDSYQSLKFSFIVAVMLIYLILAWSFKSYLQPMIIIFTIFFAIVGAILGLFFSREFFTLNVFMGIIGLAGVAVNDSIVLLDFINQARKSGKSLRASIVDGCGLRMRAIILTTATTIFGLLPTAIGFPQYSPTWSGMAISFISGLFFSTFLTMLMIPVIYEIVESIKIKFYNHNISLIGINSDKKITPQMIKPTE